METCVITAITKAAMITALLTSEVFRAVHGVSSDPKQPDRRRQTIGSPTASPGDFWQGWQLAAARMSVRKLWPR
jgi:hypothetical protein